MVGAIQDHLCGPESKTRTCAALQVRVELWLGVMAAIGAGIRCHQATGYGTTLHTAM